jgi:NADH-ubiquinone oxidoreductase chain 6
MNFLFYFFSSLAIISGIMVIQARNPVYSVLFLILVFFNSAGLLILLGLDFFAMIFLVVYVGAIAVLFLFVVMMLNIKLAEINEKKLRYFPIGGLLGVLFLVEIFLIVNNQIIPLKIPLTLTSLKIVDKSPEFLSDPYLNLSFTDWSSLVEPISNIQAIGQLVYTYYVYYFLVASFILLVAMIGAIVLTMHKNVGVLHQQVFQQNTREFAKTVQKIR